MCAARQERPKGIRGCWPPAKTSRIRLPSSSSHDLIDRSRDQSSDYPCAEYEQGPDDDVEEILLGCRELLLIPLRSDKEKTRYDEEKSNYGECDQGERFQGSSDEGGHRG